MEPSTPPGRRAEVHGGSGEKQTAAWHGRPQHGTEDRRKCASCPWGPLADCDRFSCRLQQGGECCVGGLGGGALGMGGDTLHFSNTPPLLREMAEEGLHSKRGCKGCRPPSLLRGGRVGSSWCPLDLWPGDGASSYCSTSL